MTIFPLIKRELLVRARGRALYWTRFGVALLATIVCLSGWAATSPGGMSSASMGKGVFDWLVGIVFFLNCAACLLTMDAISRERREGTLGLLFLARVNGLEVLLGKFGASGVTGLCALAAFFPLMIIPVLAGGVTGGEAFRKSLVLIDVLTLSLAAGLWGSAVGRNWLRTAGTTLGVLTALLFAPLLLQGVGSQSTFLNGLGLISPLALISTAGDVPYKLSPSSFWVGFLAEQVVAWALLWHAGIRLRRSAMDEEQGTASPVRTEAQTPSRPFKPCQEPVEYLMRRQRGLKAVIWGAAIVGFLNSTLSVFLFGAIRGGYGLGAASITVTLVQGPLFAWAVTRFFVEARRGGELELLLTTPRGARDVVSSQWKILKRYFVWPVLILIAPMILRLAFVAWEQGITSLPMWRIQNGINYLLIIANIILGVAALCWVGLWFGYRTEGQSGAIVKTVCLAKVGPFILSQLVVIAVAVVGSSLVRNGLYMGTVVIFAAQLPLLGAYFWMIQFARRRLKRELPDAEGLEDWRTAFGKMVRRARSWRTVG